VAQEHKQPARAPATLTQAPAAAPASDSESVRGSADVGGTADSSAEVFGEAARQPASPLPYQAEMEDAFGRDFSGVKAHLGASDQMGALGANAAASGDHVAFASPSPDRGLVAHELTHTVQQQAGGSNAPQLSSVSAPSDSSEQEANTVAAAVGAGEAAPQISAAPSAHIHLDPVPGAPTVADPGQCTTTTGRAGLDEARAAGDGDNAFGAYQTMSAFEKALLFLDQATFIRVLTLVGGDNANLILHDAPPEVQVEVSVTRGDRVNALTAWGAMSVELRDTYSGDTTKFVALLMLAGLNADGAALVAQLSPARQLVLLADPTVQVLVLATGVYPTTLLPGVMTDAAQVAHIANASPVLALALVADPAKLRVLVDAGGDAGVPDWIRILFLFGKSDLFFELATTANGAWPQLVKASGLFAALATNDPRLGT
jgi:hypothetical protein